MIDDVIQLFKKKKVNLQIVKVPEGQVDEMLDEFYNKSAFTFEGLEVNKPDMEKLMDFLRERDYNPKENVAWYWFSGDVMNNKYGLTGSNAYSPELTFVVIPDYYNPLVKLQLGARWFDDIVDNNARRQLEED